MDSRERARCGGWTDQVVLIPQFKMHLPVCSPCIRMMRSAGVFGPARFPSQEQTDLVEAWEVLES